MFETKDALFSPVRESELGACSLIYEGSCPGCSFCVFEMFCWAPLTDEVLWSWGRILFAGFVLPVAQGYQRVENSLISWCCEEARLRSTLVLTVIRLAIVNFLPRVLFAELMIANCGAHEDVRRSWINSRSSQNK